MLPKCCFQYSTLFLGKGSCKTYVGTISKDVWEVVAWGAHARDEREVC
jgi:hypothetical protein